MSITVRGKFRCTESAKTFWNNGAIRFTFDAVYDADIPEDRKYAVATPSGKLEITVTSPSAAEQFELGEYYYLDLTKVAADETVTADAS